MKKHAFILLFSLLFEISAFSQVMFVDRFEIPSNFIEKDFIVVAKQGGLVAFRVQPEKGLNFKSNLQYFLTDFNLNSDNLKEIKVRDGYDLVGYDLEGEFLYILMQKK